MDKVNSCQYCSSTFKSATTLKTHLITSKKCLKKRGLPIESKFICGGCNHVFMTKLNINVHQETCKDFIVLKAVEACKKENEALIQKNDHNILYIKELQQKLEKSEKIITEQNKKIINNEDSIIELEQMLVNHENTIKELQTRVEKTTVDQEKYLTLKVRYEELEKSTVDHDNYLTLKVRYEELEKQHDKTITKLELKISQCDAFIQTLAREGSNKVTTTNNTVNNTIRNHLSSTYTVEGLEPKQLEDTMRQHYTESDFFGGQKRLADFWVDHVIKTPDNKMMVCCTDVSRKKFKILDIQGNLKEDIEARLLCKKLKVPVKMVTKEIYDTVIERIEAERDRLSSDDRSRREKLLDDSMRAQQMYMDNLNFDDLNYNQDFMHELCVLLNV
jgi:hypothetical protein